MIQQKQQDDFVISTGETRSVRELCGPRSVPLPGHKNTGYGSPNSSASGVDLLWETARAAKVLGWKPKVNFDELVSMLFDADLARNRVSR